LCWCLVFIPSEDLDAILLQLIELLPALKRVMKTRAALSIASPLSDSNLGSFTRANVIVRPAGLLFHGNRLRRIVGSIYLGSVSGHAVTRFK